MVKKYGKKPKMRVYKDDDGSRTLRIRPEGWVDDLVLDFDGIHSCGQAEAGIGIRINEKSGGVLTLDDLIAIHTIIAGHIRKVSEMVGDPMGIDSILFDDDEGDDNEQPKA